MEIICDPSKRLSNIAKHGLDLETITEAFFETARVQPAKAGRSEAIGRLDDAPVALIFKPLGLEAFALISLRPASKKGRTIYDALEG